MKKQLDDKYPKNYTDITPLLKAAENGHFDIVKSLLDDFAKLDWDTQNRHIEILTRTKITPAAKEYAKTIKILQNVMDDQCPQWL